MACETRALEILALPSDIMWMRCKYLCETADGLRCVMMSPEHWRLLRKLLLKRCQSDPESCELFRRTRELSERMRRERAGWLAWRPA